MFDKEVYIARRKALLERLAGQKGIALFLGNVEAPAQYKDNCYKWRQDSNWLYFFGIDEPRFAATVDLESGEETLYADDFEIDDIIWMGPMPTVRSLADRCGVAKTAPYDALGAALKGRQVHFLPASRYYNRMKLGALLGLDPAETISAGKAGRAAHEFRQSKTFFLYKTKTDEYFHNYINWYFRVQYKLTAKQQRDEESSCRYLPIMI